MKLPTIPALEDEDTYKAVNALASAASTLRAIMYKVANGASFDDLMEKHGAIIFLSDAVVEHWKAYFDSKDATKH